MAEQNFVDYVRICFRSGSGGAGSVHFLREKYVAFGGPDGGDGGRGGHIILRGNRNVWTLLALRFRKHVYAGDGENGGGNQRSGKDGEDIILDVPLGTVVKDAETGKVDMEITEHDQQVVVLPGGRGGLGNSNFKSSTNQAPKYAQPGEEGITSWKILELKVLADVGLVGFPNAGKSTLLSVVSAAKPKIANYAFTTITPNIGIVKYRDARSFAMADIPGIIEGAHKGKGLGHQFLRHIERNATLLFLISGESDDISAEYKVLLNELEMFNPELIHKPRVLAITKSDLLDEELKSWIEKELPDDLPYLFISAVTQEGITGLKDLLWKVMHTPHKDS